MTPHVLHQLPLWVEGDLDAADMAAVDRHLAQCPECRAAAEDLRASQDLLREAMASPFETADRERLRGQVMAQVRAEAAAKPARRLIPRSALLAACAASLLLTVFVWRRGHEVVEGGTPQLMPPPLPEAVLPSSPPDLPSNTVRRQAASLPHPRGRPAPRQDLEPASQGEPARIEFQTADPNIRIIWLAQAKPLPETDPFPEKP